MIIYIFCKYFCKKKKNHCFQTETLSYSGYVGVTLFATQHREPSHSFWWIHLEVLGIGIVLRKTKLGGAQISGMQGAEKCAQDMRSKVMKYHLLLVICVVTSQDTRRDIVLEE